MLRFVRRATARCLKDAIFCVLDIIFVEDDNFCMLDAILYGSLGSA